MIYEREILKGKTCPDEYKGNLLELLIRINKLRDAYSRPMLITSGFRSEKDQIAIYAHKGITDKSKIPMRSKHLFAQACDVYDPDKQLQKWIKENVPLMEEIGLWFEDFTYTPNWVHIQTVPPKSGSRFFRP